ncbi:hypothetical protein NE865_14737 [Phthorimaea operculella]|nr:hypothetical protein NE865_14737 [Phthorimaea operculella]
MSKRPFFPQQGGDRKKAKLDVTISDHNFPLSQNGPNKEHEQDNWGDDNDDEILLLASQACEDAYNDMSSLPDYSMCMQPVSTSTQMFDPGPSTSKSTFSFKKPSGIPPSAISSNFKDKCNRISSPLPGMSSKVPPKRTDHVNLSDDFVFNDKIFKGTDSDIVYKQLLQLQEENAKLKSENGKLLEKCVTKEGEASILRTQLKSSQIAVDNARMEKIKAQEKVQMEWTEKLNATNSQIHELRTQLDFKNLEIISIKERCKMLESNKVKLTQVTVPSNDISSSQRMNSSFSTNNASLRKPKLSSSSAQTEDKAHFLKLNKTCRTEPSNLPPILPSFPTTDQHSLLEYHEKRQNHAHSAQHKCRVYSTFHTIPSASPSGSREVKTTVSVAMIYEDLTKIAAGTDDGKALDNLLSLFKTVLKEVQNQLELVSRKMTTAFQKEMDERYIEATTKYLVVDKRDLLCGRPLFKEEQAILARRVTAVVAYLARTHAQLIRNTDTENGILELIQKICSLLDSTSCALLYSGFLLSATTLISNSQTDSTKTIEILKHMISSRPMPFVSCEMLQLLRKATQDKTMLEKLCPKSSAGNLRLDYDQGVLLYKKDSCYLQVLLKQVESALKCIAQQNLTEQAIHTTTQLIAVHSNLDDSRNEDKEKSTGCDCQLVLLQVIVYALRIVAVMWKTSRNTKGSESTSSRLLSVCTLGTQVLYTRSLCDVEFSSHLAQYEGHLQHYADIMRSHPHHEIYVLNTRSLCDVEFSSHLAQYEGHLQHYADVMRSYPHHEIYVSHNLKQYTRSLCDVEFSSHLAQYEGHLQHYADIMRSHPHHEIYLSHNHMQYTRSLCDVEFSSHLAQYEGHLQHYADVMRSHPHHEIYANMLSELSGSFQSSPEEGGCVPALLKQPWITSFDNFSIAD